MMRRYVMASVVMLVACLAKAQLSSIDPYLDRNVEKIPLAQEKSWNSCYMWYPGQLAAYLQQWCLAKSKERCVNVGYPGKFFSPVNHASFRKVVNLRESSMMMWIGRGKVTITVNGKEVSLSNQMAMLPSGRSVLQVDVITDNQLPCVMLAGNKEVENMQGWQVCLDGKNWTLPESDKRYNSPLRFPDNVREQELIIKPTDIFSLRNSSSKGNDGVEIGKNGYALVDFYHLETGNVSFRAKGQGQLQVRVGETPGEALNTNKRWFEQKALPEYELSEEGISITLPERALRYAVLESTGKVEIDSIRFHAKLHPVDYQMQFESDDEYLNRLFDMSRATMHTSMHGFYLDGVKRDFLPWAMDAIVSSLAGNYLFGDSQIAKNGISVALMPWNPKPSDLGVTDYPLHALIGLYLHYQRFGDLATSLQYKDRIIQLMDFYTSIADGNGFVAGNKGTTGYIPGWTMKNGPAGRGVASYPQMMLYLNCQIAAFFADQWKDGKRAATYRKRAEMLRKNIVKCFWNEEKRAFINGTYNDGKPDERISHHAQYWAVLADLFPKQHIDNLFSEVLPHLPHYYEDVSYEKGYEMLAYAKAGYVKEMWQFLNRVFGDWMNQGHTRFAENFSPKASRADQLKFYARDYGLSLCHGANGAPVVVGILNGILGFKQSTKQLNVYDFHPQLLHLNKVNARIPVKEGFISLRISKDEESEIEIPSGCKVKMVLAGKVKEFNKRGIYKFVYHDKVS